MFTGQTNYVELPLLLVVCIIASIVVLFVRLGSSENIMGALYKGFIVTAVLSAIFIYFAVDLCLVIIL